MWVHVEGDAPYGGHEFFAEATDDPDIREIPGWRRGTRLVRRRDGVIDGWSGCPVYDLIRRKSRR